VKAAALLLAILTPIAAAAGTAGGVWLESRSMPGEHGEAGGEDQVTDITTSLIVVPHVTAQGVAGYLVARFVVGFSLDAAQSASELTRLATEDVIVRHLTAIAGSSDYTNAYKANAGLGERLQERLNAERGDGAIASVRTIQFDYMGKSEVRTPRENG
jgi:hypothetical protein